MMSHLQILLSDSTCAATSWYGDTPYARDARHVEEAAGKVKEGHDVPPDVLTCVAGGLHSLTFPLNVSAFCGTGGAFRGCLGGV